VDQDVTLSTLETNSLIVTEDRNICGTISDHLIQKIGRERFEMWFGDRESIQPHEASTATGDIGAIVVWAESTFSLARIKSVFGSELREIVDRVCGPRCELIYKLVRTRSKASAHGNSGRAEKILGSGQAGSVQTQLPLEGLIETSIAPLSVNETAREPSHVQPNTVAASESLPSAVKQPPKRGRGLKSFWFGDENRLAEASVAQVFEQPGQFTPFFVYGPTGSGKTHLLEAISHEFRNRLRCKRCVMLSAEQFTSLFVSSLRGGDGLPVFRRKYRDLDLLVIDDIQFLAGKRATVNEFYHTIEILVRAGKQVVLSADRPAIELGLLGGDLGNRLSAGLSCPIRYPELAGRREIASRLCKERSIELSSEVIQFIVDQLPGDIRRISGALNRLHAYRISVGQPVTVENAQSVLSDLFSEFQPQRVSLGRIEAAICDLCGLKPAELKSNSRRKTVCTARMLAMYLSREYTSSAFSEIGSYFGGRSHSTAIAARKQVNRWLEGNQGVTLPHATYRIQELIGRLKSNLRIG
jgi:chromosomal replication initiator protein